ncbi:putative BRCT domain-containing protein [Helianthus annuus]|uniref:BRCT domain-containing protein n=2 Tax=Helianthus annuus TaxID=4232 RepID=A0A9K3JKS0_HELAN|nr:putative BRCT domain-containing protein [Helianthus annuus]KAJ0950277.1 putative BRCT domain-containing protein [Helianthus annuus]
MKLLLRAIFQTMVELMGAQVSKPLIATKITHLICYKFEGDGNSDNEELKVMSKEVEYSQLADVATISSKCWEL